MDELTAEERDAIAAYKGPVTVCPPRTYAIDEGKLARDAMIVAEEKKRVSRAKKRAADPRKQRNDRRAQKYAEWMREGKSAKEIASIEKISLKSVLLFMNRRGLQYEAAQNGAPKDRQERIELYKALRAAGETYEKIGQRFGISRDSVKKFCLRHGVNAPKH